MVSRLAFLLQVALHRFTLHLSKEISLKNITILSFENRLEKMTSPEFAVSATPPGCSILSYHSNKIYKLHDKRHLSTVWLPTARKACLCIQCTGIPLMKLEQLKKVATIVEPYK